MSRITDHGRRIAEQIQSEDAYGSFNNLTLSDVYYILDNIHTHFIDTYRDTGFLDRWMDELYKMGGIEMI